MAPDNKLISKSIKYNNDKRIVLTLDAGGTNFVFAAIKGNIEITDPINLPSNSHDLKACINTIIDGFSELIVKIKEKPAAISFAFPGSADHKQGIIKNANNLSIFKDGVPLGPILSNKFNMPVFINNDGDLFTYGEAHCGFLPFINKLLEGSGQTRRYSNLLGLTLGTGFGAGIVSNGQLYIGDNSMGTEVWLMRNRINPSTNAEEGISIGAIRRVYAEKTGIDISLSPDPKSIFDIAEGNLKGDQNAALEAFHQMGVVLGDVLGNLLTMLDCLVVIGGGISGAMKYIYPSLLREISTNYTGYNGISYPRLSQAVFNLDDPLSLKEFCSSKEKVLIVPETGQELFYAETAKLGIGTSRLGTSKAIAIGAYAFALNNL
jgi:glucokinase